MRLIIKTLAMVVLGTIFHTLISELTFGSTVSTEPIYHQL